MSKYIIIFDFDGTIADSFKTTIEITRKLLGDRGHQSQSEIDELRKLSLVAVARTLNVPLWRVPFLIKKGRRIMNQRIHTIQPFPGLIDVIQDLSKHHQLAILSSNSKDNILKFLKQHNLDKYFTVISGGVGVFSKRRAIERLIKRQRWDRKSVIYIGDEIRDIEAAEAIPIKILAVSWGYNDPGRLKKHNPTLVIDEPKQLVETIKTIEMHEDKG